jgi:hypothetical protein
VKYLVQDLIRPDAALQVTGQSSHANDQKKGAVQPPPLFAALPGYFFSKSRIP